MQGKMGVVKESKIAKKIRGWIAGRGYSIAETERLAQLPEGSLYQMLAGNRAISEKQIERLEEVIEEGISRKELTPASYYMREI